MHGRRITLTQYIKVYMQRKETKLSGTFLVDSSITCW